MARKNSDVLVALSNAAPPSGELPQSVDVELPIDPLEMLGNGEFSVGDDGSIFVEEETTEKTSDHDDNLVDQIDEKALEMLGREIVEMVDEDIRARDPWRDKFKRGLDALGIFYDADAEQSDVFGDITHPLLIEAATQFQARAYAELLPAEGPVKVKIVGEITQALEEQAQRVQDYMNYQLVYEDRSYYTEKDKMLYRLPFSGSEFDKQYIDPITGNTVSRWVKAEDFIVPFTATTLSEAPRYTHRIRISKNNLKKQEVAGYYTNLPDYTPSETRQEDPIVEKTAEIEGVDIRTDDDEPADYTLYEAHIDYDLPGFEDADGVALPYRITVDAESKKVLAIYRNWDEDDETRSRVQMFSHKYFLPGFGFYGFGLIHAIGGLSEAATKTLQILLDAGAFASLQGGFKSKECKIEGDKDLVPGEWQDTDMTADELSRAFYTPPFKEPSQTLFQLLGTITSLGQRFAATTEVMVGDAATSGPVGTTVAQIEQGSKVFSGIHKRLHRAFGDEFINIAKLNSEALEDYAETGMSYGAGAQWLISPTDFDERIDVIPVSDPNIFTAAQRIAMAQSLYQMATSMPDIADRREASVQLCKAMRIPEYEKVFPLPAQAEHADPVTEASMVMMGRPIQAFEDQDHEAHVAVHMAMLQTNSFPPEIAPRIQAHVAEHTAMQIRMNMQLQLGMALPPLNYGADKRQPMMAQQLPPEMENQIAMREAQVAQQMLQQYKAAQQQQDDNARKEAAAAQVEVQKEQIRQQSAAQQAAAKLQADTQQKEQDRAARMEQIKIEAASRERVAQINAQTQKEIESMREERERERELMQMENDNANKALDSEQQLQGEDRLVRAIAEIKDQLGEIRKLVQEDMKEDAKEMQNEGEQETPSDEGGAA